MRLPSFEKTDGLRRLALQLALQLPESVEDARRVLEMTGECLDGFLIEKGVVVSPLARARRLGWRLEASVLDAAAGETVVPSVWRAVFWALGTLMVSTPLALLLSATVGAGAGFCFGFAVIGVAMVFGTGPALLLAAVSPVVHNLVILPPLAWQSPSLHEWVSAAFYLIFAVAVPPLLRRLDRLRRLAARPLRHVG